MCRVRAKSVSAVLVGWVLAASPIAAIGSGNPHPSADRCADVTASGRIPLKDRVLVETPDIDAPELRLANALVSARCFDNVQPLLEKDTADHPDDYREYFVDALSPAAHAVTRHAAGFYVPIDARSDRSLPVPDIAFFSRGCCCDLLAFPESNEYGRSNACSIPATCRVAPE